MRKILLPLLLAVATGGSAQDSSDSTYHEHFRPQIHFSPKEKWMNDPNGLIYHQGTYHLFFQHYPGDIIWGPMHWGHAVSKDLIHWRQLPIALYPDSLGYIFSGSMVFDSANTSGLGKKGAAPLVAIFTHHDPAGEKRGDSTYQNESLAYSLDNGQTWTKYKGNPVLRNPGIQDFRDPNVKWYAKDKKWIMSLATKDRITFYSSPDLKEWTKEGEFGERQGAHEGVWECPDLFPMELDGTTYWVLLVSINPGGPNGGSATQYFIGQFDGHKFYAADNASKWIDYGPDDYAGVTWSRGKRKIFLGWMSNWLYANQVPTSTWRNAMTIPRELRLVRYNEAIYLASMPAKELRAIAGPVRPLTLNSSWEAPAGQYRIDLHLDNRPDFYCSFSNDKGQQLVIGYDSLSARYYIDRILSGVSNFNQEFPKRYFAPAVVKSGGLDLTIVMDAASVEVFADQGLTVMTSVFFPSSPLKKVELKVPGGAAGATAKYSSLRSIWK